MRHETYDERREQILKGALKVFAEKGYSGASNKDIAAAASINTPALIYHYFDNKEALFAAVIETFMPTPQLMMNPEVLATLNVEEVLKQMASTIIAIVSDRTMSALMRIMLSESLHENEVSNAVFQGGSQKIFSFMYQYLDGLMSQGIIKRVDLGTALRCFMGPFAAYVINDCLLNVQDQHAPDAQTMIDTTISIFLRGLDYQA